MASAPSPHPPLWQSLRIQARVIDALLRREMLTRYGRHNIGFLWLFVEPMIFTIGVTILWTATKSVHGSDLPISSFALTGYSSVLLWRNMPGRCIGALQNNLALMYHRNIKVGDIYAARLLIEFGGATISFFTLGVLFIAVEWMNPPEDFLKVAAGWMLIAWFGCALAILMGALSHLSELVDKLWHPFSYLLFPLSGAAFIVAALPSFAQEIVLYIPTVHGIEFVREGFFGSRARATYDLAYLVPFNLVLTLVALIALRYVSRRVVPG
ncbi:MAG: ABC transporter permease [Erythrobacter sp.]|jgi:ABC-2 type transport system permease protein/capsular polysaccharide transport system permease protein|uniref:ABC transporter permease n=1 Tax=Erythrobacter sp. TaxID=1042 RepID=UPI002B45CFD0|nr:ABC transporter permease [Erythrobacter sp.]WRH69542.1 MAG: ABC transporter permease [Erythrobacter sp.]